jgi:trk system potassium uptake protein
MKVIVVGGGKVGHALSKLLLDEKHEVTMIEKDEKRAEAIAEKIDALVLHGDGSESDILKDANIDECDAIIAMTDSDKTNLMICEMAKATKVPVIISKINDVSNEGTFMKIGIHSIINTTNVAVTEFKKALQHHGKRPIVLICGGKAEIFEIVVDGKSKILGKSVKEVPKKLSVAAINRNGELIIPTTKTIFHEGDIITVCASLGEVKGIEKEM